MLSRLAYKRPVVEINGQVYPRGGTLQFTADTSFAGVFVADTFLRGAGQGQGGDADGTPSGYNFRRGERGENGDYQEGIYAYVGSIVIVVPVKGVSGIDTEFLSGTGASGGDAPAAGDTTITADGLSVTATGGAALGNGAFSGSSGDSSWTSAPTVLSPSNPLGGNYGRGQGYSTFPVAGNPGVVQIKEIID